MKERITITIDHNLLNEVDKQVDGKIIKNRSHAIELGLSRCFKRNKIKEAVILAGGNLTVRHEGEKLPPFLVKIRGKTVLEHNIELLKKQGIEQFIIPLGEYKDKIKSALKKEENLGTVINYINEEESLGTAGILKKASEFISGSFVVCNSHELKDINLEEMYEFHKKQGTIGTLAITTISDPKEYGVVVLNGTKIYSFIEKPETKIPSNLISAGFYIFEPEIIKMSPEGFGKLEVDVFPKLASKEELAGYIFYGKWQDIRDDETLIKALDW